MDVELVLPVDEEHEPPQSHDSLLEKLLVTITFIASKNWTSNSSQSIAVSEDSSSSSSLCHNPTKMHPSVWLEFLPQWSATPVLSYTLSRNIPFLSHGLGLLTKSRIVALYVPVQILLLKASLFFQGNSRESYHPYVKISS